MKILLNLIIFIFVMSNANADDKFKMKEVQDFKTLKEFKSVKDFDSYINEYMQDCFDDGYGGAGSLSCLVKYSIWDRELNINYRKLYDSLDKEGKRVLKTSQNQWLKTRDLDYAMTFHSIPNDGKGGTGQILITSDLKNEISASIVKARTLLLIDWLKALDTCTKITDGSGC